MSLRRILLSIVFIFIMFSKANATQITINKDGELPSSYYDNTTDFSNNASSTGIMVNSNNSGDAWQIQVNQDVTVNQNTHGIRVNNGKVNFNSNTSNYIQTNQNSDKGIFVTGANSKLTITNVNIEANANLLYGIVAENNGKTGITGNGNNFLKANGNKNITDSNGYGIYSNGAGAEIDIKNMNIEANNNSLYGLYANNGGKFDITGNGDNLLKTNNNKNKNGTYGYGLFVAEATSKLTITNMNIEANNNSLHGIYAYSGGKIDITGNGNNFLKANGNKNISDSNGYGIYSNETGAKITLKNMNIEANNNGLYGIYANNGGKFEIIGNGYNFLQANNNKNINGIYGYGIFVTETNSGATITNMNIEANNNDLHGIYANNGAEIDITGNGSNSLKANNNKNTANTSGYGIYSHETGSKITIKNMNIEANNNGLHGIYAYLGGKIDILGNGNNSLKANNNRDIDGSYGYGIYANSLGSEIKIEKMNIEASKNSLHGIYANNGGKINIEGSTTTQNLLQANNNVYTGIGSNQGIGIYAKEARSEINIENMNIQANNNMVQNLRADAGGKIIIKGNGKNFLQANNSAFSHGFGTNTAGIIDITGMDIEASNNYRSGFEAFKGGIINITGKSNGYNSMYVYNNNINDLYYSGIFSNGINSQINIKNMIIESNKTDLASSWKEGGLNFDNSILHSLDNYVFTIREGNGKIVFDNSIAYSDTGQLLKVSNGTFNNASFSAQNSDISGKITTEDATIQTSNISLSNTTWRNIGRSNISNLALTGVNDLYMNVYFGNDATKGDLLTIENSATSPGTNNLHISSAGGDSDFGSSDKVIINQENAGGTILSDTKFNLAHKVDSGFYEYDRLATDSNKNIVLQSNGQMTNTARTIASMPAIHINIIKTGMNELRKRMGDLRENSPNAKQGAWVRTYAKHLDVNEKIDAKMNIYGVEGGYDYQVYSTCENKVYLGAMAGYLYTDNIKLDNKLGGKNGSGLAKTPSVGLYTTWMNNNGWFADATVRYFWSDMKAHSISSSGQSISYNPDRDFITTSFEVGKRYEYQASSDAQYLIEPKVEFQYAYAKAKDFITSNDLNIHYGKTESKALKVGSKFGYQKHYDDGSILEPFIEINLVEEFAGKTDISYAGGYTNSNLSGFSVEFGGGLNAKLNESWNFYSDVMYEKGSTVEAVSGNVGVRYNF